MGDDDRSIRRGYTWDHVRVPVEVVLDDREYEEPQEDGSTIPFRLGTNEKALYLVLALHADWGTGECFPSLDRLAHLLSLTRPTVIKAIKRLELAGLLESSRRSDSRGRRQSNLYVLHRGQPQTTPAPDTRQVKSINSAPPAPSKESLPVGVKNFDPNLTTTNLTIEPEHGGDTRRPLPGPADLKEQAKARRKELWDGVLAYFGLASVEAIPAPTIGKWRVAINKGLFDQGVTGEEFRALAERLKERQPWRAITDPMVVVTMLPYLRANNDAPALKVVRPGGRGRGVDGSPYNKASRIQEAAENSRRRYANQPPGDPSEREVDQALPGL